jgi:hypothetical protein
VRRYNPKIVTWAAGFSLIIPAFIGLPPAGGPTLLRPLPALTVLPALILSYMHCGELAIGLPSLLFLAWNPQLLRGETTPPKRSYILLGLLVVLSVIFFWSSWQWGIQYQGRRFTIGMILINFGWIVGLGAGFWFCRKLSASYLGSLILHWLLFAWVAWYAFPWLGEML